MHAPTHVGRVAGRERAVDALRAAQPELQHLVTLGGGADARGLGGDEGVEVEDVEQRGLDELALEQRPLHRTRGSWANSGPFGRRVDVERQPHLPEPGQELLREEGAPVVALERAQVRQVAFGEAQPVEPRDGRMQPARDGVAPSKGFLRKCRWKTASRSAMPLRQYPQAMVSW